MLYHLRFRKAPVVDLTDADFTADAASLLDRSSSTVANMLDRFRADEIAIESDIADLTEQLRQTRVAITAFEAAGRILDDGKDVAVAPPTKIGRLVPRAVPAAVHTDIRA